MHIGHFNLARGFSGGERQTAMLVKGLSNLDIRQTLFLRKGNRTAELAELASISNLTIVYLKKPFILRNLLNKHYRSLTHLHVHEGQSTRLVFLLSLLYDKFFLITRRVEPCPSNNFLNRIIFRAADKVICISEAIQTVIQDWQPTTKTAVISSVKSDFQQDQDLLARLRTQFREEVIVGTLAQLIPLKGLNYLVEAFKNVNKKSNLPTNRLIILGDGPELERLKGLADGHPAICFLGFKKEVGTYLSLFDIFVLPSLREGLGSSIIDAMDHSLPVIASKVGGIPELVENERTGFLIEPANIKALEEKLEYLMRNENIRRSFGDEAKRVSAKFTKEMLGNQTLNVYKTVAQKSNL